MKRTAPRNSIDKPQPTCVMTVRLFRSKLEMVSLGGACKEKVRCFRTLHYRHWWLAGLLKRYEIKNKTQSRAKKYITKEIKHTNKMAKNVKCEHWHVILSPLCSVTHPSSVQFGLLPKRREHANRQITNIHSKIYSGVDLNIFYRYAIQHTSM